MRLKVEDFMKFRNFIYQKAGIYFAPKKIYFMKKRLEMRMKARAMGNVMDYFNYLKYQDSRGVEIQELLNILTTNETYFFRELNQLEAFSQFCLREVVNRRRGEEKRLRIWSAGCSTGEEAYSLAILLIESLPDVTSWNVELIASDIDTVVIEKAREGLYTERSVRTVSPERLKRYFLVSPDGYRIRMNVKRMVTFKYINLFDTRTTRQLQNVDFIFCRNVLIYFDEKSRKTVVANFYDSLAKQGYLFLGHSESVSRISTAFRVRRAPGGMILHQKP